VHCVVRAWAVSAVGSKCAAVGALQGVLRVSLVRACGIARRTLKRTPT
jgi:hypothetical protein